MSGPTTSVFLLTENRLLREALVRILASRTSFSTAGAMAFADSSWDQLAAAQPDVVVSDSFSLLFGSDSLISRLRMAVPSAKLVLVGMERDESQFLQAISEGVVGYTLKDATAVEIIGTIRAVVKGEAVCPPSLSLTLFQCAARAMKRPGGGKALPEFALSRREQQLVYHLVLGMTNKEIACKLNISDQTVKNHVHRILRKLGAKDRQMVAELWGTEAQQLFTADSLESN